MSQSHSFSVEFAEKYGVEAAILINHFQFWISQNQATGKNFHDGRTWMYQTQKEIAAIYPYWSEDTVFRIIKKLIDEGVLIKGNYNKASFDKTTWYAFENEIMFTKPRNRGIETATPRNGNRGTAVTIPDTNTHTNVVVVGEAPQPPPVGDVHNKLTKDDIYHYSLSARTDWKPEEIEMAWSSFERVTSPITDPYAYIGGIIKKKRMLNAHKPKESLCKTTTTSCSRKTESEKPKSSTSDYATWVPVLDSSYCPWTGKKLSPSS